MRENPALYAVYRSEPSGTREKGVGERLTPQEGRSAQNIADEIRMTPSALTPAEFLTVDDECVASEPGEEVSCEDGPRQ